MKRATGFTLMEMLVTLIIAALAVMLMFQALASFNHARQRSAAIESVRDNRTVMADWVGSTIRGIVAIDPSSLTNSHAGEPQRGLTGDATGFTALTLSPLEGRAGVPAVIGWRIVANARGGALVYSEAGGQPITLPMGSSLRFSYLDHAGKWHAQWPARQGTYVALPDAIELTYVRNGEPQSLAAAIAAPIPRKLASWTTEITH